MNDESPTGAASEESSELENAVAAAVEAGITEIDELKSVVTQVAETLDGAANRLIEADGRSAAPNAFAELSSTAAHALVMRIDESRSVLETFNIASSVGRRPEPKGNNGPRRLDCRRCRRDTHQERRCGMNPPAVTRTRP